MGTWLQHVYVGPTASRVISRISLGSIYLIWSNEHPLKTAIMIVAVVVPLLLSGKVRIQVNSYTVEADEFVIHAVASGSHIDLLCEIETHRDRSPRSSSKWAPARNQNEELSSYWGW